MKSVVGSRSTAPREPGAPHRPHAHYRRRLTVIVLALATPLLGFALLLSMQRLEERLMSAPARVSGDPTD